MLERLWRVVPALVGLALFIAALSVLDRELHAVSWQALSSDALATPPARLLAAALLTALNYAVLTGYDFIAVAGIGRHLARARIAWTSFLAYAIANNVGFAMLSGTSVRYRFYTRWGLSAEELSRIVFSCSVTFWLGLLALGGLSLASSSVRAALPPGVSGMAVPIGATLFATSLLYVVIAGVGMAPIRVRGFELPLPSVRVALLQWGVSIVDWALAGAVFYVLLPARAPYLEVLGAFIAAQFLGLASHLPGGVGVFETLILLLLKGRFSSAEIVPALVVYRAVYYLAPLSVALVGLVVDEVRMRRPQAARLTAYVGRLTGRLTPQVLAVFTFIAGAILLFSGATPAAGGRLALLDRVLPLGVIEASHITGSVIGAMLLLLSQGLARRLDAAYFATVVAVASGMVVSLLKGGDIEEALVLGTLLVVLRQARPAFDRTAAFFATRFSPAWVASVAAALFASVWLGMFAFKHVEYSHDPWWQFELDAGVSRFLRASVAASTVVLLFAVARLIRHAPHEVEPPSDADLKDAAAILEKQPLTYPYLVYLRDKALLFTEARDAFLMYGVQGRTWVALGDPVGPPARVPDLVRLFIERCDDFGGTPVFYEAGTKYLHHYADFGLAFVKVGEEARVDLSRFSLEGPQGARFRQLIRRLDRDGGRFRVLPCEEVGLRIEELRAVSDDWLQRRAAGEKGFSLGHFDPEYVGRFPVAVVEREGHAVAFATLWPGACKHELSVDLMRYHHDAPRDVMEALFAHLMVWGKDQSFGWFALGMAPMSGFERSPVAPLWARAGNFLFEHGTRFYNFQGLRAYKDKFDPVWESRYLVYPGGLTLLRILADVSALVSGGYRRIFAK